jgi:4-alpha-glucanotransferase
MTTDPWGVADGYEDALGIWHEVSAATRDAIRATMDAPPPRGVGSVRVLEPGASLDLDHPCQLRLEDGTTVAVERTLPPDVPLGYHDLEPLDGAAPVRLIVSPGRCVLPEGLRAWGWAIQLYAMRSQDSWGIGDLADLRRFGRWSTSLGTGFALVNPLHAPIPVTPLQNSPYFPSSRRFLSPLYLRVEEVPGASELGADLERMAAEARRLNAERWIDRDRVWRLKLDALERLWQRFGASSEFDRFIRDRGPSLREFAVFSTLAEHHQSGWSQWPTEHRRPEAPGVAGFAQDREDRVRFHQWLQWLLDRQLAHASEALSLMHDLPIGVDPEGADAWAWQDVLATGATVGAPPDSYNARGQDWGLPPFIPHRLRERRYAPFVETLRAALRHAGGLRIDHVMGLFRLFWIPRGRSPSDGAYVRYPAEELLAILALESHRARAVIVGEDLGTVEHGVRETLAARGVLSYRVTWFESDPPARYPHLALAAVTTHDLPTIAGLWTGLDVAEQERLHLAPNAGALRKIARRLADMTGLPEGASTAGVIETIHRLLAEAPSALVTATLEDALEVTERPNMPGTSRERPNWSIALPQPLERLEQHPLALAIARALAPGRPPAGLR